MSNHLGRGAVCAVIGLAAYFDPSQPTWAQTFDVKQLDITRGALELGSDNTVHLGLPRHRGPDINRSAHDLSLDYGLSSWWRLSGVLKFHNPSGEPFRLGNTAIENLFVLRALGESRTHDIGLGWFTALDTSTHRQTTNAVLFGPIVMLKSGDLSFTANPFFEKTYGRNRVEGIAANYAWHAKALLTRQLAVGVEGFRLCREPRQPAGDRRAGTPDRTGHFRRDRGREGLHHYTRPRRLFRANSGYARPCAEAQRRYSAAHKRRRSQMTTAPNPVRTGVARSS